MKKLKLFLIAILILLLASCDMPSPKNPNDYLNTSGVSTWEELFKGYWSGLSDSYVFWNLDDKNGEWDDIYYEYLPKFKALGKINPNDMKNGILLLSDITKDLSDGHFNFEIIDKSKASGKYYFSPAKYRILKENNPSLSSDEIIKILYESEDLGEYYPDDLLNEDAFSILENTFKLPLVVDASTVSGHTSLLLPASGKILNPKLQERITYDGQAILYSNKYPNGTYLDQTGHIVSIPNGGTIPSRAIIGPYYPLSDLDITDSDLINRIFAFWTLFLGASYQEEYVESTTPNNYVKKHSASINLYSLAGLTKENGKYESNTVYFLLSGFTLYDYIISSEYETIEYLDYFHDLKMDNNAKGFIIDLRGNGGGYNIDRQLLFGDLFETPFKLGYQINKAGIGRQEYTIPAPIYIFPEPDLYGNEYSTLASKPVAVITNIMTVSNGEVATNMVKAFDKGKQVGGKTLGGQGTLAYDSLVVNAGQFSIGNYIKSVYTPFAQVLDANGVSHEGIGCIPDINVAFNLEKFKNGIDERLEASFNYIKESN